MDIWSLVTNRISGSTFWFPSSDCAAQNTHPISQNKFAPSRPSPSNHLIFSGDEVRVRSVAVPRSTTRTLKKNYTLGCIIPNWSPNLKVIDAVTAILHPKSSVHVAPVSFSATVFICESYSKKSVTVHFYTKCEGERFRLILVACCAFRPWSINVY